jgi:hypothetical protein
MFESRNDGAPLEAASIPQDQHTARAPPRPPRSDRGPRPGRGVRSRRSSDAGWRNGKVPLVDGVVRPDTLEAIPSRRHDTVVPHLARPLGIVIHDRVLSRPCRPARPAVDISWGDQRGDGVRPARGRLAMCILSRSSQMRGACGADSPADATASPMSPRLRPLKPRVGLPNRRFTTQSTCFTPP